MVVHPPHVRALCRGAFIPTVFPYDTEYVLCFDDFFLMSNSRAGDRSVWTVKVQCRKSDLPPLLSCTMPHSELTLEVQSATSVPNVVSFPCTHNLTQSTHKHITLQ